MGYFKQARIENWAEQDFYYRKGQLEDRLEALKNRLQELNGRMPENSTAEKYGNMLNGRFSAWERKAALAKDLFTVEDILRTEWEVEDELEELVRAYEEEEQRIMELDVIPGQMNLFEYIPFIHEQKRA